MERGAIGELFLRDTRALAEVQKILADATGNVGRIATHRIAFPNRLGLSLRFTTIQAPKANRNSSH